MIIIITTPAFFLRIDVGKKAPFCYLIDPQNSHFHQFDNTQTDIKNLHIDNIESLDDPIKIIYPLKPFICANLPELITSLL